MLPDEQRDEDETMDALCRYCDHLRSRGIRAAEPVAGDESGWGYVSDLDNDLHVHRRPRSDGKPGYVWLCYGSATSSFGSRADRAPLVATAYTLRRRDVPAPGTWQWGITR